MHEESQGGPHSLDIRAEKGQVSGPEKVFRAAPNEILGVNVVSRIVLGKQRLDDNLSWLRVSQSNAELINLSLPQRVTIKRDHGIDDSVLCGRIEIHPPGDIEITIGWRPLDEWLAFSQSFRFPTELDKWNFKGVTSLFWRGYQGVCLFHLDNPAFVVHPGVFRSV
jgi:hypothetical protein